MKKIVVFLMILIVLFATSCGDKEPLTPANIYGEALKFPQNADFLSTGVSGDFQYIVYSDHAEILSCEVSSGQTEVTFPSEILGKKVTVIGDNILMEQTGIKKVTIPNTVTTIGNYAFYGCTSLTDINMPAELKKTGSNTFSKTPWFNNITAEFAVVGKGVLIKYNGNAEEITVPSNVGYLADAFKGNDNITKLVIPETVKGICDSAFAGCYSLIDIDIAKTISDIGAGAFDDTVWLVCQKQDFVTVGNGVLIKYNGTDENVVIGSDVKYISGAFYGNKTVKNVTVPVTVKNVTYGTFTDCKSLESVEFKGMDTVLAGGLFYDCDKLKKVILPSGLKMIPDNLFYGCLKLEQVNIPGTVKYIGDTAFYYCDKLTELTLPDGIKEIGTGAFYGCTVLEKMNLPNSISKLGEACFACCYALEIESIPVSVTVLESTVFSYCDKMDKITVSDKIYKIGTATFEGDKKIEVTVLGKNTILEENAFGDNTDRVTLICVKGSVAEKFAQKNNIKFTSIKE